MRLLQIQYFLTIADTGSITKAAQQLYLSQPALTKQMNQLEAELGVELLKRMPRGVALTEAGEQFAADLRKILEELDLAVQRVSRTAPNKILRIGCFDGAVIEDFMPSLYQHINQWMPHLQIKLSRRSIRENREALESGDIDLLIELQFPKNRDVPPSKEYCKKLLKNRNGAIVYSPNSPLGKMQTITPEALAAETYLIPSQKNALHLATHGLQVLKELGVHNPKTETVENLMTMISNIELGLGYGILSVDIIHRNPQLSVFQLPPEMSIDVVAIWKRSNQLVTSFMESYSPDF